MAEPTEVQREALHELRSDIDRLRSELGELLHTVKGDNKDRVADIKARLREAAASLESHAHEHLNDAYERLRDEAAEQIKKRPLGSAAVCFAAGVVLSLYLLRR